MGLTTRPSKNTDFSKINDIQNEFFGEEISINGGKAENAENADSAKKSRRKTSSITSEISGGVEISARKDAKAREAESISTNESENFKNAPSGIKKVEPGNMRIADLLATAKIEGVRYTSRPFTVPRSLTIDLNRLKSKFRTRDLQYTQNELMDKMIKESLEIVTAINYFSLREKAFKFVKSPEQCSRRSVTLTEETVSEMAELKADLALALNRRISGDEIFTTLLAVAFSSLYENGLL